MRASGDQSEATRLRALELVLVHASLRVERADRRLSLSAARPHQSKSGKGAVPKCTVGALARGECARFSTGYPCSGSALTQRR